MARGDVLRVDLQFPRGGGHVQGGRRPAIAVQADDPSAARLPTLMVVPLTGQLAALRFPYTIQVEPSSQNGLTQPSVLLVFQLRALDRPRVEGTIGHLEEFYLNQLDQEIRRLLNLL